MVKKNSINNNKIKDNLTSDSNIKSCNLIWNVVGAIICLFLCYLYPIYLFNIFDARVFFTGITEIEREINFRTENGLYYSYYKQLVNSSSFLNGLYDLTSDQLTEHPTKINILARMNIYQEVILAFIYRFIPTMDSTPPIFFYVTSIFKLHSLLILAIYLIPWFLSKSFISGLLCVTFYIFNSVDSTRVDVYMPLRECFALPFLWMQILFICLYFGAKNNIYDKWYKIGISIFTFFFALFWQFNQFALLLQAISLFVCMAFNMIDPKKVKLVLMIQLNSIIVVGILQFLNLMIFSGLLVSFIISAIIFYYFQKYFDDKVSVKYFIFLCIGILSTAFLALSLNSILKFVTEQESDEHIKNFVLAKFGFKDAIDFDVWLYLCNGGFAFIDFGFFERLTLNIVFPIYAVVHLALLLMIASLALRLTFVSKKRDIDCFLLSNPEWIYLTIQATLFGILAIMTLRMKFFWAPLIFILSSAAIADIRPWRYFFNLFKRTYSDWQICLIKNSIVFGIIAILIGKHYERVRTDLTNLREFYDPDTVELIKWINEKTAANTSFTGSMQLMAAIKLGTGHPIANHPHYEDKVLRLKTKELYCMYGRYDADHVWHVMRKHTISYMILEDSICRANKQDGCGLPNILDKVDTRLKDLNLPPRFCEDVRLMIGDYAKYFKLVFQNKTFHVYQVLEDTMLE